MFEEIALFTVGGGHEGALNIATPQKKLTNTASPNHTTNHSTVNNFISPNTAAWKTQISDTVRFEITTTPQIEILFTSSPHQKKNQHRKSPCPPPVGWFSVDLNLTSRVLSRFSSFLLHQKSTLASRTSNHPTPYSTDIDSSFLYFNGHPVKTFCCSSTPTGSTILYFARSLGSSGILFYYILCVDISVIKPWIKMIPVKWYDIISRSEMISYHFTGLSCPIK